MKIFGSPFSLRSAEKIQTDATFVELFEPGLLDILGGPASQGFDSVQIIRSAPGGGKTSLLRLFTPGSLLAIHELSRKPEIKDLHLKLTNLGVLSGTGPLVLGTYLSVYRNYETLEHLDLDDGKKLRLFIRRVLASSRLVVIHKSPQSARAHRGRRCSRPCRAVSCSVGCG